MSGTNGQKFDKRKEWILLIFGLVGIAFVIGVMPALHYEFHIEYLMAFLACIGIPLARWGDRK